MRLTITIMGILLAGMGMAVAASLSGVIVRTAALKETPAFTAKTLTSLAPGARVKVLERQGGWQHINLQAAENVGGWVRMYEVRTDIEPGENPTVVKSKGSDVGVLGGLAGLSRASTGLFSRREVDDVNRGNVVATIGVRGLSEKDLKNAKPNPQELEKLHHYTADAETAAAYAKTGGLSSSSVDVLPEVARLQDKK